MLKRQSDSRAMQVSPLRILRNYNSLFHYLSVGGVLC